MSFTGSTATGRRVMASAADTLKRVTLEPGGNDAAIVLPDVDVAAVAEQLFWAAFRNDGRICIATKRMYVHRDVYELAGRLCAAPTAALGAARGLLLAGATDAFLARRPPLFHGEADA